MEASFRSGGLNICTTLFFGLNFRKNNLHANLSLRDNEQNPINKEKIVHSFQE
jgi:hypothetical protein